MPALHVVHIHSLLSTEIVCVKYFAFGAENKEFVSTTICLHHV